MINTFNESCFTDKGKKAFSKEDGIHVNFTKFMLCSSSGVIDSSRTSQNDVKYSATITKAENFRDGDSYGYMLSLQLPAGALSSSFNIEELGLYSMDGSEEVLSYLAKPDTPIPYTVKTEINLDVIIPIEDHDIVIDVETNPKRLGEHNTDRNAHPEILKILDEAGLTENRKNGKPYTKVNVPEIEAPVHNKFYYKSPTSNKYVKAMGNGTEANRVVGFLDIQEDGTHIMRFNGMLIDHQAFEAGKIYYLSDKTSGEVTTTRYGGAVVVGHAIDNNTLLVDFDYSVGSMESEYFKVKEEFRRVRNLDFLKG